MFRTDTFDLLTADRVKGAVAVIVLAISILGCDEAPLKPSKNWFPRSVGGPIIVRPLPRAIEIQEDYSRWLGSASEPAVRLYETTITSADEQRDFKAEIRRGETPMGRPPVTFVSFHYANPTNGLYELEWMVSGKQSPELLRVRSRPRKFLLKVIQTKDVPIPKLQIVAVEGVEGRGLLIATTNQ